MTFWMWCLGGIVQVSYFSVNPTKSLYAKGFSPLLTFFQCYSQLRTTILLLHLSNTSTVPTPKHLFPAPLHQMVLSSDYLGMPTPHGLLIPCVILSESALNSWSGNASAMAATIELCSTTLWMWYGCLGTCALGGARCLVLVLFSFFKKEILGCQL